MTQAEDDSGKRMGSTVSRVSQISPIRSRHRRYSAHSFFDIGLALEDSNIPYASVHNEASSSTRPLRRCSRDGRSSTANNSRFFSIRFLTDTPMPA
jgi:hypothetical protein